VKPFWPVICLTLSVPALAPAQVIINQAALAQLRGLPPAPRVQPVAMVVAPAVHRVHHKKPAVAAALVAPKPVVVVPVVAKPIVPVVAKPVGPPKTMAVDFADGSSALPADAAAALKPFCSYGGTISVNAHAASDATNPSDAMRLSLQRALAIRDALVACGVPSSKILPMAMGAAGGTQTMVATGPQK